MVCEIFSKCDASLYLRIAAATGRKYLIFPVPLKSLYKIDFLVNNFSYAFIL